MLDNPFREQSLRSDAAEKNDFVPFYLSTTDAESEVTRHKRPTKKYASCSLGWSVQHAHQILGFDPVNDCFDVFRGISLQQNIICIFKYQQNSFARLLINNQQANSP